MGEKTYCIDNASKDVVAWILVLVVLVAVRIGHLIKLRYLIGYLIVWRKLFYRSQESTKDCPSVHSAPIALLVLVFILLVSVWTAKDVTKVETD